MRSLTPVYFLLAASAAHAQRADSAAKPMTLYPGGVVEWKAGPASMPAGSFGFWLAGTRHFAWMEGETILQVHGQGPWTITYVNPADDPRNHAAQVLRSRGPRVRRPRVRRGALSVGLVTPLGGSEVSP